MIGIIARKILGTYSERQLKRLWPFVASIS